MDKVKIRKRDEEEDEQGPFAYHSGWPYLSIGFGDERDYFIENLSLLIAGGLGVTAALAAIKPGLKNRRMRKSITEMIDMVSDGFPLWRAFERTKLFPPRITSILKAGEESGRLPEYLGLVSIQQHRELIFLSRVRSALLYPAIVLAVALVVGVGSAWYTLPKLTSVLEQSSVKLPVTTILVIWLGNFFAHQGLWAVPGLFLIIFILIDFIFIYPRTKFVGENIILVLPGIKKLIQGVEVARFGFLFGAMLQAGIPVGDALNSVREGTSFTVYKKFYSFISEGLMAGNTLEFIFKKYRKTDKLIPLPMQQLIIAAEKSGKLPETLIKIGQIFDEKTESMGKDLAIVLEPIVLVLVGVIVGIVALGIISPIYSLVNQIQ